MTKFRKKPVVIEARQYLWTPISSAAEIVDWADENGVSINIELDDSDCSYLVIPTLEGNHRADNGDWIIKGVAGEFYPCKPDIFEATYEPAEQEKGE
ncbi:MAG: hypothetical protein AAGD43_09375 [Pseudomonadota bacterium]